MIGTGYAYAGSMDLPFFFSFLLLKLHLTVRPSVFNVCIEKKDEHSPFEVMLVYKTIYGSCFVISKIKYCLN